MKTNNLSFKEVVPILVSISILLAGVTAIVKYNTFDLSNRILITERVIAETQKEVEKKADNSIVDLRLTNLQKSVDEIKEDTKKYQTEITGLLKQLINKQTNTKPYNKNQNTEIE